ncbi:MAG: hypothetical protein U0U67_01675 [Chitinophagales bacterium]
MKKIVTLIACMLIVLIKTIHAQNNVGVGTNTPDASAKIDITSSNKGLLIPRIALTGINDAVTIPSPATSLLVYNTTTAGIAPNNVTPGFYYNSGTSASPVWTRLASGNNSIDWLLANTTSAAATSTDNQYVTGNVGVGDFSASTPSDKLHVKGNIRVDNGKIPFVNTGNSVFIGNDAGKNDDLSNNINVFVGNQAGYTNTNGEANTFVGINAGFNNTTGNLNTALGAAALDNNTTGNSNVAVGRSALSGNTTGSGNIAVGEGALHDKTSGDNNVVVGNSAGYNNLNGSDNIFLGKQAGYNETGSNKLYIENSSSTTPLIYGDFSTDQINVNGSQGINTLPNASAVLDISSASKGVRLPNIALTSTTDASTISSPATSLLIFNTATAGISPNNVTPGFYYNSNTPASPIWTRLNTSNTSDTLGWTKALTTGTKATKTDNQYVTGNIGVGNFSATSPLDKIHVKGNLRIDSGRIDFRNTGQSVFIGESAGLNDDLTNNQNTFIGFEAGKSTTTGNINTFVGHVAGQANTTGGWNTALGQYALGSNTTGGLNTALGRGAMASNTTGNDNTSIGMGSISYLASGNGNAVVGSQALYNTTSGSNNSVLGYNALRNNTSTSNNVAVGTSAGQNNISGSNNIFLGYNAGLNETGSNKLYIENTSSATPLIYGDFASNHITINDSLTSKYFQMTNGATNGFVLRSDAAGNATWINPATLISDTSSWTKALSIGTKAIKTDNQYVTGNIGVGDFSATSPLDKIHVKGNLRIDGGKIDFRNTGASVFIGQDAGLNDDLTVHYNTFTGYFSGKANTTGSYNTGYGAGSLETNITGFGNTAIGRLSLLNAKGSKNTALGLYAGANTLGDNSVFIGSYAGQFETGGNKLYISNSNTATPLIYGDFSSKHITINDSLTSAYFQMKNGAANGFVLQSDATGNATWTSLASLDTSNWTKALTTSTKASQSDNQYVTGRIGVGDFSATTPNANIQVIGNANIGSITNSISGTNSLVTGDDNSVSGNNSFAAGVDGINEADNSILGGFGSRIEGGYEHSIVVGNKDTAQASAAAVFGYGNKVTAYEGFAAGDRNKVSGQSSVAFGASNNVSGQNSLVSGNNNTVNAAHALVVGNSNTASGDFSVVLNNTNTTTAAATASIAGGFQSYVSANLGLAIGFNDSTTAQAAAAFGFDNNANGQNSFVIGSGNIASSYSETALGMYGTNYVAASTNVYNANDRILNVGNGTNSSARSDAFTILKNGNTGINNSMPNSSAILDITSSSKGVRLPNIALTSTTDAATITTPATSLLIYNTATAGVAPNNVTPGFYYNSNTSASPIWKKFNVSVDTLGWTKAATVNTQATRTDNQYVTGKVGIGDFSATTPNANIQVIGNGNIGTGNVISGTNSFVTGINSNVSGNQAFSTGGGNNVSGNYSVALNNTNTTTSTATTSIVGGYQSYVTSNIGLAIGYNDTTTAQAAAAFGFDNNAAGSNSFVTGSNNNTVGTNSFVAGGNNNIISGTNSFATGINSNISGNQAFSAGGGNNVNGNYSVALNNTNTTTSTATTSIVGGYQSYVTSNIGLAIGQNDTTTAQAAAAFGFNNNAAGANSLAAGTDNVAASFSETSIGINGTRYTPGSTTTYNAADRIFNVGNGTSAANRADAFTILKNGNIGIGIAIPSYNVSFATGANKIIGAERSTTVGTYYNLTVQAGGAMTGQNNQHGGDLILSGGIATGNGGSAADLGSNVIIKTATPLGSSSSADQTPTEKMRIKGDGTVNITDLALTNGGDRRVFVDASGNLKAYDGIAANRNVVTASSHAAQTFASNTTQNIITNSGVMNVSVGDVIIINAQVTLRLTTGSNTDDFFVRITNSGSAGVTYSTGTTTPTDLIYRPDESGADHDNYRPTPYLEYGTVTSAGTVNFTLVVQNNGDDQWETRNAVMVVRKE